MNSEKKTEIKVGLTVIVGLILFILVYGWAKNLNIDSDNRFLELRFPTVSGLEIGDMVSVNGVRKGLVEEIESGNNFARVKVQFNEQVEIMDDATFSIMMLDLMGGKKIEISSGTSGNPLDLTKVHQGTFAGDVSSVMATLHSVENDLVDVIHELKLTLENANTLFDNPEFTGNIKTSVQSLNRLIDNLNLFISENREAMNSSISNIEKLSEQSALFIEDNRENVSSLIANMDSTLIASNKLINKLDRFSDEVKNSENNLGKLLYDENLLDDLKTSITQIKELTGLINEQLKSGGLEVKADVDLF